MCKRVLAVDAVSMSRINVKVTVLTGYVCVSDAETEDGACHGGGTSTLTN